MFNKLKRCWLPLLSSFGILPVTVLLSWGVGFPRLSLYVPAYLLCGCLCAQLRGKWRLTAGAGFALCMAALGVAGFIRTRQPVFLLMGFGHAGLMLFTLPAREFIRQEIVFTGLLIHVAAQIWLNLMDGTALQATYAPVRPLLTATLVIFLACSVLTLNQLNLASALPEAQAVPGSIRRRNRLLTFLMLVAALLISLIPALGRWLTQAWDMLRTVVAQVIRWLIDLYPAPAPVQGGGGAGGADFGMLGEAAPTSPLAVILEKIMLVLAFAFLAVLLVKALRILGQKLMMFLRWGFQRLQSYASSATEDYVDELQNTREQGDERFLLNRLRRRRISARELEAMPPRERIRVLYAIARRKHPEWPASGTARETLKEESARIYERARYSSHPVTEEDADRFTT